MVIAGSSTVAMPMLPHFSIASHQPAGAPGTVTRWWVPCSPGDDGRRLSQTKRGNKLSVSKRSCRDDLGQAIRCQVRTGLGSVVTGEGHGVREGAACGLLHHVDVQRGRRAARSVHSGDRAAGLVVVEAEGVAADARGDGLGHVDRGGHRHRRVHAVAPRPYPQAASAGERRVGWGGGLSGGWGVSTSQRG